MAQYFDHFINLEFMRFSERKPIEDETIHTLAEAYNKTPPNFVPPSDEVIEKVIKQVDKQIEIDKKDEVNIFSDLFKIQETVVDIATGVVMGPQVES